MKKKCYCADLKLRFGELVRCEWCATAIEQERCALLAEALPKSGMLSPMEIGAGRVVCRVLAEQIRAKVKK